MAVSQVEVIGARQFRRTLREAGRDMSDLKAVHYDAAKIAAVASAALAPVRTGKLRDTIRAAGTITAAIIRAGYLRVPYVLPIHWGWGRRHIKAQPFLSDGARDSEGRWIRLYQNHVEETLDQIKGQ